MNDVDAFLRRLPYTDGHIVYHLAADKYGDRTGEEVVHLYIGVTSNLPTRLRAHSRKWWWAAVNLDHTELQDFPTREAAEAAEAEMIRFYQPEMNRAGRLLVVTTV